MIHVDFALFALFRSSQEYFHRCCGIYTSQPIIAIDYFSVNTRKASECGCSGDWRTRNKTIFNLRGRAGNFKTPINRHDCKKMPELPSAMLLLCFEAVEGDEIVKNQKQRDKD